jgi:hypothetical protein
VTTPPNPPATLDIIVTAPGGTSAAVSADQFTFTAPAAPTVTGLGTTSGGTGGGTLVTVTGTGFTGATAVMFGNVAATSYTISSDTSLVAIAPPQAAGTVDITVTNYGGTSSTGSADRFTYNAAPAPSVTFISPSSGSTTGGTTVTIFGSNFTGASAISFGSVAAAYFTVTSDIQITAVAPAQAAGTYDITVTTPSGTSSTGSADRFTCNAPSAPAITGLSATSGSTSGGSVITITGSGFTGATAVNFGRKVNLISRSVTPCPGEL